MLKNFMKYLGFAKNNRGRQTLPWWSVLKNPPSNAGDAGLIPGQGTKIPYAMGQLSPRAATREKPTHHNKEPTHRNERSRTPQLRHDTAKN